jgi:hypothetical protein
MLPTVQPCPNDNYPSYTYFIQTPVCKPIKFPLKFKVENTPDKNNILTSTAVVDIILSQNDGSDLELDYLSREVSPQDYKIFTFLPVGAVSGDTYVLIDKNTLRVSLKIAETFTKSKFTLEIKRNPSKMTPQVQLQTESKTADIIFLVTPSNLSPDIANPFTEDELKSGISIGNMIGQINRFSGYFTDYLSYLLIAFGYDLSSNFLKFTQMIKLLSRFRFLFI